MSDELIRLDTPRTGVLLATLSRPERLNALTFDMFDRLGDIADEVDADRSIRALVITGEGRGFCAGLDLDLAEQLSGMTTQENLRGQEHWAAAVARLRRVRIPVIAAVNGPAAGAGFSLALTADVRMASVDARFNAAFVRIGLSGGDCGSSWLLPRIVGFGHASELLLTGRVIDAEEALRIGLVNRVLGTDELVTAALDLADEMARNSPFGLWLTKQLLQTNVDAPSLDAALELENRSQVLAAHTDEMREALTAFRERRPPNFSSHSPES